MRAVAKGCHVALGLLYYYFPSKEDLLIETIESVWDCIFHIDETDKTNLAFPEYIQQWFERVQLGTKIYPNFLTMHSIGFASTAQAKARETMDHHLTKIRAEMLQSLQVDLHVRDNAFNANFTETDFIDFVLSNALSLLLQQKSDCLILLEIIRRAIYTI